RPPLRVLPYEVRHDIPLKPLRHVPHVERDPDHVGGPPRIPRVLQRAAPPRPGPVRLRVRRQRQRDAGRLPPRLPRPPPTPPPAAPRCAATEERPPPDTGAGTRAGRLPSPGFAPVQPIWTAPPPWPPPLHAVRIVEADTAHPMAGRGYRSASRHRPEAPGSG